MAGKELILYFILSVALSAIVGFEYASAATVYQTTSPTSQVTLNANGTVSSRAIFRYTLPKGISFDRIRMVVPNSDTTSNRISGTIYNDAGDPFYSCTDTSCLIGDTGVSGADFNDINSSVTSNGVKQYALGKTLTTSTSTFAVQYLYIVVPDSPNQTFNYGSVFGSTGYSEQLNNINRENNAPAIILCNLTCDTTGLNPLPEITASPWIRITAPVTGASTGFSIPVTVQANTGTTSADNVVVQFTSSVQNLLPYSQNLTTTGLNTISFTETLPALNDQITIKAYLYSSTTLISVSNEVIIKATNVVGDKYAGCQEYDFFIEGLCEAMVFLFVPGDFSTGLLSYIWENISMKPPFGYVTVILNQLEAFETEGTALFDFGDIPFVSTIFTPLHTALAGLLWAIYAIYFYRHRLTQLDI